MNLDAERQRLLGLAMAAPPGPYSKHGPWISAPESEDHRAGNIALAHGNKHWRPKTAAFLAAAHDMAALIRAQDEENAQLRRVIDKMASRPSTDKELLLAKQYGEALQMIEQQAAELERLREDAERMLRALIAARPFVENFYDYQHPSENGSTLRIVDAAIAAERKGAG